jgi:hypothetical protein
VVLEGAAVVTVVVRTVVKSYSATSNVPNQSAICIRLYYNGYLADELFDLDLLGERTQWQARQLRHPTVDTKPNNCAPSRWRRALLGGKGALRALPNDVDAVVSLCRVGDADLLTRAEQIDVRLIDQPRVNDKLGSS